MTKAARATRDTERARSFLGPRETVRAAVWGFTSVLGGELGYGKGRVVVVTEETLYVERVPGDCLRSPPHPSAPPVGGQPQDRYGACPGPRILAVGRRREDRRLPAAREGDQANPRGPREEGGQRRRDPLRV